MNQELLRPEQLQNTPLPEEERLREFEARIARGENRAGREASEFPAWISGEPVERLPGHL